MHKLGNPLVSNECIYPVIHQSAPSKNPIYRKFLAKHRDTINVHRKLKTYLLLIIGVVNNNNIMSYIWLTICQGECSPDYNNQFTISCDAKDRRICYSSEFFSCLEKEKTEKGSKNDAKYYASLKIFQLKV